MTFSPEYFVDAADNLFHYGNGSCTWVELWLAMDMVARVESSSSRYCYMGEPTFLDRTVTVQAYRKGIGSDPTILVVDASDPGLHATLCHVDGVSNRLSVLRYLNGDVYFDQLNRELLKNLAFLGYGDATCTGVVLPAIVDMLGRLEMHVGEYFASNAVAMAGWIGQYYPLYANRPWPLLEDRVED